MNEVQIVKPGDFLWWKAERMFKAWDVPCQVISVTKRDQWTDVLLMTFDDFKSTTITIDGETWNNELSPSTANDVAAYLIQRKANVQVANLRKETEIAQNKVLIQNLDMRIEGLLNPQG